MSVLAKTSIFLAGSLAGAMFAAAVMGSAAGAYPPVAGRNMVPRPTGAANCAPGFTVTNVYGNPVASPGPGTPSYGWTCITPVVHCVGAPGGPGGAQITQNGNGFGRVSYKCIWVEI
jgi:hypothetical protein